jgi:hypothetical protein
MACVAAFAPIPPALVERVYSTGAYPIFQRTLTPISNRAPFALIDLVIAGGVVWFVFLALAVRRLFRRGEKRRVQRVVVCAVLPAAALYLAFVALWGFNYRRRHWRTSLLSTPRRSRRKRRGRLRMRPYPEPTRFTTRHTRPDGKKVCASRPRLPRPSATPARPVPPFRVVRGERCSTGISGRPLSRG